MVFFPRSRLSGLCAGRRRRLCRPVSFTFQLFSLFPGFPVLGVFGLMIELADLLDVDGRLRHLDVHVFKQANDVDIAVTPTLYATLRASGQWDEEERYGKIFLKKEAVEINPRLDWERYATTAEEAIASATIRCLSCA